MKKTTTEAKLKQRRKRRAERLKTDPEHKRKKNESQRRYMLFARYGITPEEKEQMLQDQGGTCAICPATKNLVVDHDHSCCPGEKCCGKCIRGLLCNQHNWGLGNFDDDTEILSRAIKYLENHRS